MNRALLSILLYVLVAALGAAAGWMAGAKGAAPPEAAEEEAHAEDDAIPEATLRSLGVRRGVAALTTHTESRKVAAVVVEPPLSRRPVHALVGGVITKVHVDVGMPVKAGDPVVTLLRDAVPRPAPAMAAEILTPVSEKVHDAAAALRTARRRKSIAEREKARLEALDKGDLPLVSRQRVIDLAYEIERAAQAVDNAEHELHHHGLSEAEILSVAQGNRPPPNQALWQRTLASNGLWPQIAEDVLGALPKDHQSEPWTIATIGELSASGLVSRDLVKFLRGSDEARTQFLTVASLLLQGTSLSSIEHLAAQSALAAEVVIKAPKNGVVDYDVIDVAVREGAHVDAGDPLVTLHDPRTVWLRLDPIGREFGLVIDALENHTRLEAHPLVKGAGPALAGLEVERMAQADGRPGAGTAFMTTRNAIVHTDAETDRRSWALRKGMRYLVELPVRRFANRFVLPRGAVAEDGPNRVVFLVNGDSFTPVVVEIEHEGEDLVVIANDGSIT
nr:efflux RND transporter periplasmic adaptor subunit [Planctomycetota bacterium]